MAERSAPRLYDDDADHLMHGSASRERVTLMPSPGGRIEPGQRLRILWGQDMLRDVLDGRYRTIVCGVNDQDNSHGIVAQLVNLVTTSQWSVHSVTSYAKMFQEAVSVHAANDREPFVLKYDLDAVLIFALLRPKGRDHFTLGDLRRGFETVTKMLQGRRERRPIGSVSFLGASSNRLIGPDGREPSFETVLRTMFDAGYRGDVYPSPSAWNFGEVGVFPSFPFPDSLDRMRAGSS